MKQATGIDFNGMENSNFLLELAPTTGRFIGHICRNASFYPVIWDGSTWVLASSGGSTAINTSKTVAVPSIMYHLIPSGTADNWIISANEAGNERWFNNVNTCFAAVYNLAQANTTKRYKILIYPGAYTLTANISILNNMQIEFMHGAEIKNSVGYNYTINMTNGAILGSGVINADIVSTITSGNLVILHGSYFKKISCSGYTMIKANIIGDLVSTSLNADVFVESMKITNITYIGKMSAKARDISTIQCNNTGGYSSRINADNVEIITAGDSMDINANYVGTLDCHNVGYVNVKAGNIGNVINVAFRTLIEAQSIATLSCSETITNPLDNKIIFGSIAQVKARGELHLTGNSIDTLLCFSNRGTDVYNFDVMVNVNEIGNVRTMFGWTYNEYDGYCGDPFGVSDKNGVTVFCNCSANSSTVTCDQAEVCTMRPYGGGANTIGVPGVHDWDAIQLSKLSIIANRRRTNSLWLLAVGTTTTNIQNFTTGSSSPHTYIGNILPSSGYGNATRMTMLRISDLKESSSAGVSYQLSGHSALILSNVNMHSQFYNVTENLYDSSRESYCGVKNSYLNATYNNIESNSGTIHTNIQSSYGNAGTNGTTPISGSGNLTINTTDNWM